jgi:hypothetical protein
MMRGCRRSNACPEPPTPKPRRAPAARLGPHAAAPLGNTGLNVSRLGFGGYRVDDAHPVFADALARSLTACNLVDTCHQLHRRRQ